MCGWVVLVVAGVGVCVFVALKVGSVTDTGGVSTGVLGFAGHTGSVHSKLC